MITKTRTLLNERPAFTLALALLLWNLADVMTTHMVLARGGIELNPLMAEVFAGGTASAVGVKVLVCGTLLGLAYFSTSCFARRALWALVVGYAVVVTWNIAILGLS